MEFRVILFFGFFSLSSTLLSQEKKSTIEQDTIKNTSIIFQVDSRRTIINNKSVGIFGVKLGFLFNERYELGVGAYSSNLFGILGSSVSKDYEDKAISPTLTLPSNIGFHYFSIYGEYRLLNNERIVLTVNSQIGAGWVDIDFTDALIDKDRIRRNKFLIEHSLKADVKTFEWLRVTGGIGYRYLINAEDQIQSTFNAPIYIVGFSVDLKLLRNQIFKS